MSIMLSPSTQFRLNHVEFTAEQKLIPLVKDLRQGRHIPDMWDLTYLLDELIEKTAEINKKDWSIGVVNTLQESPYVLLDAANTNKWFVYQLSLRSLFLTMNREERMKRQPKVPVYPMSQFVGSHHRLRHHV